MLNTHKTIKFFFLIFITTYFINLNTSQAKIPLIVKYQGFLMDQGGNVINEPMPITFTIFDSPENGNILWKESIQEVEIKNGHFTCFLGKDSKLSNSIFENETYLSIKINQDPEMTPRQRITSVFYAIKSGIAEAVINGGITTVMIRDGAVTSNKLADKSIITEKLDTLNGISLGSTDKEVMGTIRWNGFDFQGFNGKEWVSLTNDYNTDYGVTIDLIAGEKINGAQNPWPVYIDKDGLIIEQLVGDNNIPIYGVNAYGQTISFDAGTTQISKILLFLEKTGNPTQYIDILLYKLDQNNIPESNSVSNIQIETDKIKNGWNEFAFSTPVSVSPSTNYAIVVFVPFANDTNYISWKQSNSDKYNYGNVLYNSILGIGFWEIFEDKDFIFKIYSDYRVYKCKADNINKLDMIGFAISDADKGEKIKIQTDGIVNNLDRLYPGMKYYIQDDGSLGRSSGTYERLAGVAIDRDKMTIIQSDNLGNHKAIENIKLNGHYLSGDGDNEGIFVSNNGNVGIGTENTPAKLVVNGGVKIGTSKDCNNDLEGLLRYNKDRKIMEFCDGDIWKPMYLPLKDGKNSLSAGISCKTILDDGYSTGDGMYWIDPENDYKDAFQVYCDMTTDGGGWTRIEYKEDLEHKQHFVEPGNEWRWLPNDFKTLLTYEQIKSIQLISKEGKQRYIGTCQDVIHYKYNSSYEFAFGFKFFNGDISTEYGKEFLNNNISAIKDDCNKNDSTLRETWFDIVDSRVPVVNVYSKDNSDNGEKFGSPLTQNPAWLR